MATQRELVEQLFKVALHVKREERSAFLDRECNGNAELRQEVESLLAGADASHVHAPPTADVSTTP